MAMVFGPVQRESFRGSLNPFITTPISAQTCNCNSDGYFRHPASSHLVREFPRKSWILISTLRILDPRYSFPIFINAWNLDSGFQSLAVADPAEGPGGPAPSFFFTPNWDPGEGPKNKILRPPPSPAFSQGLDGRPLIWRSGFELLVLYCNIVKRLRGGSRGRVQGVRPSPLPEMTCGFLIQLVFRKKKLCGLLVLK